MPNNFRLFFCKKSPPRKISIDFQRVVTTAAEQDISEYLVLK